MLLEAVEIVLALADVDASCEDNFKHIYCALCDREGEHTEECPWKRSRSWIEKYGQ